jgi:hypothetical protein
MRPTDEASSSETTPERFIELSALSDELALLVAQNPCAPSTLLTTLLAYKKDNIRHAVVQNPNTPVVKLLLFAEKYPRAFQENPLLPLLLLEDPNFFKRMNNAVLLALMGEALPYQPLAEYAATHAHRGIRQLAAEKVTNPELAKNLLTDSERDVANSAMSNKHLPDHLFQRFEKLRLGQEIDESELMLLACLGLWPRVLVVSAQKTPLSVVALLLKRFHPEVCIAALSRPEIPSSLIEEIFQHYRHSAANTPRKGDVFTAVAKHPNCLSSQLSWLARSAYGYSVQEAVAVHPALSVEGMLVVAASTHSQSRHKLANRADLPLIVQEALSEDNEVHVRAELVKNYPALLNERARWRQALSTNLLPEPEAFMLAKRGDDAAFDLLIHINTPQAVRQNIAEDASYQLTRKVSLARLEASAIDLLLSTKSEKICVALAQSLTTPESKLVQLASFSRLVQERLYKVHHRRIAVLVALLENQFVPVAETLASNPKTSQEQLLLVIQQIPKPWKCLAVHLCRAPDLPEEALALLLPRYWFHLVMHPKIVEWCKKAELVALFPRAMKKELRKKPACKELL